MASTDNGFNNIVRLTGDSLENQQANQPTEQSAAPGPEGAAPEQASNPPLPHERWLSESARLAVDKKTEAKKAKADSKYYAKKERIEMTFSNDLHHPKAVRKQTKLDEKHKKKLEKLDKKHDKEMATKKDKFEHPPRYAQ